MISCQNLYYTHKGSAFKVTLSNIKFEHKGITAFIGKNGSGKSTLFKLLSGLLKPISGYIDYEGSDIFMNYEEIKGQVHLISDQLHLYSHLTVKEHIQMIKSISSIWNEQLEISLSENFNLGGAVKIEQLSNGQLTKLKLLLSLSRMPKVVFIDEVINDLDLNTREYIYEALDNYTYENDSFVFVATNIIEDMERYASNIVIVNKGTIIENDTLDNLKEKYSLNLEGIYKKFNSKDTK
jgi:ABC-type multidrug transport system ATPase subunit